MQQKLHKPLQWRYKWLCMIVRILQVECHCYCRILLSSLSNISYDASETVQNLKKRSEVEIANSCTADDANSKWMFMFL